jgi:hypothetical protein
MGILLDAMCRMREKEITFKTISLTTITKTSTTPTSQDFVSENNLL